MSGGLRNFQEKKGAGSCCVVAEQRHGGQTPLSGAKQHRTAKVMVRVSKQARKIQLEKPPEGPLHEGTLVLSGNRLLQDDYV